MNIILEPVVTEEMAEVALCLEFREPGSAEEIDVRCGKSVEETKKILWELAIAGVGIVGKKDGVTKIEKLVLQIGELSSMIPEYIESCYPAAVDGTFMENMQLEIEILSGNGLYRKCSRVFNLMNNKGRCPVCNIEDWELLSGKEFMIRRLLHADMKLK